MYQSPKLLRHGNFRELTKAGLSGSLDQLFFLSSVTTTNNPPPGGGSEEVVVLQEVGSR